MWQRTTAITRRTLPEDGSIIVRFEIPYARVLPPDNETPSIKKYVVYDLNIRQDSLNAWDSHPITIERRYTDFLSLYDGLRREHASLLDRVTFPKKVLIGNLSSDLIAERSAAFEAFLDHVASTPVLRESEHFLRFLQEAELTRACQLLDERRNEQAVPLLENCFRLLNKIFMDRSRSVLLMLCRLVAACTTCPVPNPAAERWAELAMRRYESVCDTELLLLYVPLLQTCVHLWWQRGRDNQYLEERLKAIEARGMKVKNSNTLTQAIHALDPRTETM